MANPVPLELTFPPTPICYMSVRSPSTAARPMAGGYVERECTQLPVRNEEGLARDAASTFLTRFGVLQTAIASAAPADPSR